MTTNIDFGASFGASTEAQDTGSDAHKAEGKGAAAAAAFGNAYTVVFDDSVLIIFLRTSCDVGYKYLVGFCRLSALAHRSGRSIKKIEGPFGPPMFPAYFAFRSASSVVLYAQKIDSILVKFQKKVEK